ncbi:hypothetical protein F7734_40825 [Scytonema sp. UIC 10036]|uniref:hypothetical protein n=1 Tax=Scytonema sp. UIC 10036 TaxID=2304196 RepID=UPI0012DA415A|nr:hypothetical protein [Scytonema sp. UIC 10036]MUG98315.1 hypothetical protein [Scytonema sp. UIC 10036]
MTNSESILQELREIVVGVERQRDPTNADKCWVSFLKRQSPTEGNPPMAHSRHASLSGLAPQPT